MKTAALLAKNLLALLATIAPASAIDRAIQKRCIDKEWSEQKKESL